MATMSWPGRPWPPGYAAAPVGETPIPPGTALDTKQQQQRHQHIAHINVSVRQSAPRVSAHVGTGLACGSAGNGRGGLAGGGRRAGRRGSSGFTGGLPATGQQVG